MIIQQRRQTLFTSRHHGSPVWPTHDLWANDLLLWWLPTHRITHLIKFISILFLLLLCAIRFTVQLWQQQDLIRQQQQGHENNGQLITSSSSSSSSSSETSPTTAIIILWTATALAVFIWIYWYYQLTLFAITGKPWMDPQIQEINRMAMHVPLRLYESIHNARRGACLPQLVSRKDNMITPNVLLLDDLKNWKFQLFQTVEDALDAVYQDDDGGGDDKNNNNNKQEEEKSASSRWASISIPGNWMLQGFDDIPIYTNMKYPFPCRPPIVPRQNPTGVYKLELSIPEDWEDAASSNDDDLLTVLLHGIESACFVFCNGELLGLFKDSRLPSEFKLPNKCATKGSRIIFHFVVIRWSDGSYMEDQDHWWMAGIHRSVELIRRKSGADIMNYQVSAPASGNLTVQVQLRGSSNNKANSRILKGRLYDDIQLTADGSHWKAQREIWSQTLHLTEEDLSLSSSSMDGNFVIRLAGQINKVNPWTAETPNLYTLVLELSDCEGNITQIESCRIGFRTIDMDDGTLNINGKRITVCGINRHEHDPDHGKVVSMDRMHQDVKILKQNNFNAVRTSHYPTHSSFYRLCDFYGLYVCDEANIETHGMKPMGRLAHDWGWESAFVNRVRRMVMRDWNHPCIISWSLGNEAGRGRNMDRARESLLALDTSRPICYESGGSWAEGIGRTELTDVICTMYPDVARTIQLAKRTDEDRPVILCEYSHSMNNSNGNLHLYWEQIWNPQLPRLQGGYIWDMLDQGLRKKTLDGREYFAYGGDFGDSINDRQFCINGVFSPDREPHPSVAEIKFLQQPVDLTIPEDDMDFIELKIQENMDLMFPLFKPNKISRVSLRIQNRYVFSGLVHLSWSWYLHCSRRKDYLAQGAGKIYESFLELDLQSELNRSREFQAAFVDGDCDYFLKIEGSLNSDMPWAEKGHVVVLKQFPMRINFFESHVERELRADEEGLLPPLHVSSNENHINISSGNFPPFLVIDKSTGFMTSMKKNANEEIFFGQGLTTNFTRAATDNDRGGMELVLDWMMLSWAKPLLQHAEDDKFSYEMHWKDLGLSQDAPPTTVCGETFVSDKANTDTVEIESHSTVQSQGGNQILNQVVKYKIFKNGIVRLYHHISPLDAVRKIPSLPRIGLSFQLDASLHKITYYGRGPHENYADRKSGACLGVYTTSPSEMGYNYIVPSENGSRSDCNWVIFDSDGQGGLVVVDDSRTKFSFCALLHAAVEIHNAQHTCDLDNTHENGKTPISVNIDHKIMGLGGDVSWFPCVYPDFLIPPKEYSYRTPFGWRNMR